MVIGKGAGGRGKSYQSLRSRSSGSERTDDRPPTDCRPTHKSIHSSVISFSGISRTQPWDYSNFQISRINRITAHGTKPVIDESSTACFPGLPSLTTAVSLRLFRSFIKGSLAGGPDQSEAKRDHVCLAASPPPTPSLVTYID
jgi:hypothetical protein